MSLPRYRKIHDMLAGRRRRAARRANRGAAVRSWNGLEGLEDRIVLSFTAPVSYSTTAAPAAVAVGDFNGDGKPDIITANDQPGHGERAAGQRRRHLRSSDHLRHSGNNPVAVAVGDFNGDGKADIVTAQLRRSNA